MIAEDWKPNTTRLSKYARLSASPKPSVGVKMAQSGLSVLESHTRIVPSADALISQFLRSSVTTSSAKTLPECPSRSQWCRRLVAFQTRIAPDGSPAKMKCEFCANDSALASGRRIVDTREVFDVDPVPEEGSESGHRLHANAQSAGRLAHLSRDHVELGAVPTHPDLSARLRLLRRACYFQCHY